MSAFAEPLSFGHLPLPTLLLVQPNAIAACCKPYIVVSQPNKAHACDNCQVKTSSPTCISLQTSLKPPCKVVWVKPILDPDSVCSGDAIQIGLIRIRAQS